MCTEYCNILTGCNTRFCFKVLEKTVSSLISTLTSALLSVFLSNYLPSPGDHRLPARCAPAPARDRPQPAPAGSATDPPNSAPERAGGATEERSGARSGWGGGRGGARAPARGLSRGRGTLRQKRRQSPVDAAKQAPAAWAEAQQGQRAPLWGDGSPCPIRWARNKEQQKQSRRDTLQPPVLPPHHPRHWQGCALRGLEEAEVCFCKSLFKCLCLLLHSRDNN